MSKEILTDNYVIYQVAQLPDGNNFGIPSRTLVKVWESSVPLAYVDAKTKVRELCKEHPGTIYTIELEWSV